MTTHLAGDAGRTLCGLKRSGANIVESHPTCEECKSVDAERKARFESLGAQTSPPWGQRRPKTLERSTEERRQEAEVAGFFSWRSLEVALAEYPARHAM